MANWFSIHERCGRYLSDLDIAQIREACDPWFHQERFWFNNLNVFKTNAPVCFRMSFLVGLSDDFHHALHPYLSRFGAKIIFDD